MIITFTETERAILLASLDKEWKRLDRLRADLGPPNDERSIERQQQIIDMMDRLR